MSASTFNGTVFTDAERVVIEHWFDQCEDSPPVDSPVGRLLARYDLRPERCWVYATAATFVATTALAMIEDSLPTSRGNVDIALPSPNRGARHSSERLRRKILLLPRPLFEINWRPRLRVYRGPIAYYATWFPGYSRWVVTASADTTHLWGVQDAAIGWFMDSEDLLVGVRDVIVKDWRGPAAPGESWDKLIAIGRVDDSTARAWRDEVWSYPMIPHHDGADA